jgi:hypothetical protein
VLIHLNLRTGFKNKTIRPVVEPLWLSGQVMEWEKNEIKRSWVCSPARTTFWKKRIHTPSLKLACLQISQNFLYTWNRFKNRPLSTSQQVYVCSCIMPYQSRCKFRRFMIRKNTYVNHTFQFIFYSNIGNGEYFCLKDVFATKIDHNIVFWEKRQIFCQKLAKIEENFDHYIDPYFLSK